MNPARKQRNQNRPALRRVHETLWRRDEQGVTVEKALIDAADSTAGGIQIDRYPREKALRRNKFLG
jgi:hypothetical protein